GSTFALGATTVGLSAADAAGNAAAASFSVTVQDTTAPVITPPANIIAEATSAAGAPVSFTVPVAADLVSGSVTVGASPASGSTFALGTTTVALGAGDAAGNAAAAAFTVTVVDTTAPVIQSLTATPGVLWPPNHKLVAVTLTALVSDVADPAPRTRIVSVSSLELPKSSRHDDCDDDDEHDAKIRHSRNDPDWVITGDLTLQLRAERAGKGGGRVYTITVESKDAAGNVSTGTVTVTVPKSQGHGQDHDKDDKDHDKKDGKKGDKDDDRKDDKKGGKDEGKKDGRRG
ncbi:MAG: HYR domain-containing protein, partial [Lacunisphaera sp.]|nr:HYR domain-containing protein [Lacunisphaera sp.]